MAHGPGLSQPYQPRQRTLVFPHPQASGATLGYHGVIIRLHRSSAQQRPFDPDYWMYSVFVPSLGKEMDFAARDLFVLPDKDPGELPFELPGPGACELRFDEVPGQNLSAGNNCVTGAFRRQNGLWRSFIFRKIDQPRPTYRFTLLAAGGDKGGLLRYKVPLCERLDREYVLWAIENFTQAETREVNCPLRLRQASRPEPAIPRATFVFDQLVTTKPTFDHLSKIFPPPPRGPVLPSGALLILLGGIGLLFAVMNVTLFPATMRPRSYVINDLWVGVVLGSIGAEAGLLTIAAVLAPGRAWARQLVAVSVGIGFILAWALGLYLAYWRYEFPSFAMRPNEVVAIAFVVPALFCAAQAPLWFFRSFLGWRIEPIQESGQVTRPPKLSIAGILAATTAVALALASVRLGFRLASGQSLTEEAWWLATGVGAAFTAGISLATLPVATCLLMRFKSSMQGILLTAAWYFAVAGLLIAIISLLTRNWPDLETLFPLAMLYVGFTAAMAVPLFLVRLAGYRLVWGREGRRRESLASPNEKF